MTVLWGLSSALCPMLASSSAPSSPTSVRFLWAKSSVAPLSADLLRASVMWSLLRETDGRGDGAPFLSERARPCEDSTSEGDMGLGNRWWLSAKDYNVSTEPVVTLPVTSAQAPACPRYANGRFLPQNHLLCGKLHPRPSNPFVTRPSQVANITASTTSKSGQNVST